MIDVNVSGGDITLVEAEALVTTLDPAGNWFGSIDALIQRCAGNVFHATATKAKPLIHGQVVHAIAVRPHAGKFGSVLFVTDNRAQHQQTRKLIASALRVAEDLGIGSVTVAPFRMDTRDGAAPLGFATWQKLLREMAVGVRRFQVENRSSSMEVNFVIHNNPAAEKFLVRMLRNPRPS